MTKRRCFLSLLLIIVLSLTLLSSVFATPKNAFASTNMFVDIKNHSFENSIADWNINDGNFDLEKVNIISTGAYDASNYLQVEDGTYIIESQDFIDIENNSDYLFGVKVIFAGEEDSCIIKVKSYNAQDELISTNQSQTLVSKQEYLDKWQEVFLTLNKDSNVKKVKIVVEITCGQGAVGVDKVYAYKSFINLFKGASLSLERNIVQIRFTGKIDTLIYQEIIDTYSAVSVGMILAPKSQVDQVGEFTFKGIPANGMMMSIPAEHWNNKATCLQDGYYAFSSSFGKVGYDNINGIINGEIVVRAYIKFIKGGKEEIIYSSWSMQDNCRSIRQVATLAKQDTEVYNSYSPDQQEIISAYIEQRTPNFDGLD